MGRPTVRKTVIEFTVYHRDFDDPASMDLADVISECDTGSMIGQVTDVKESTVPDGNVVDELIAIGNDGSFFDEE